MEISSNPYPDIHTAFSAYLKLLGESIPFDLWMITRTSGKDWIVLQSRGHGTHRVTFFPHLHALTGYSGLRQGIPEGAGKFPSVT